MTLQDLKKLVADPCVITLIGMSGSGKSTLAQELAEDPTEILSSDDFRKLLTGDPTEQRITGVVFQMIYDVLKIRSEYRQRTIIDATNLQRRNRKGYYGPVTKGLPAYAIIVKAPEAVCKARQGDRDRQVPEWVVEKHASRFEHVHENVLDEYEKWEGVFEYDTESGEVKVLR